MASAESEPTGAVWGGASSGVHMLSPGQWLGNQGAKPSGAEELRHKTVISIRLDRLSFRFSSSYQERTGAHLSMHMGTASPFRGTAHRHKHAAFSLAVSATGVGL